MYFGLLFITIILGVLISAIPGLFPTGYQYMIPDGFRFISFMMGFVVSITGFMLLLIRAKRTGAEHLIKPAVPGTHLWFYIFKNNEMIITPAIRSGEGFSYSPRLDAMVPDIKSYSLADHKVRIVPEIVGHAVDVDYVLYTNVLRSKYGFENLHEVRNSIFGVVDKVKNFIGFGKEKLPVEEVEEVEQTGGETEEDL